jgi:pSer/pThr/pTyr-binding forkhead associated (FHA) protein
MATVTVEIQDGPYRGRRTMLRLCNSLRVGRTERADWVIPVDPEMSGLHFSLDFSTDHLVLRDLQSTNGTFRNGQRIEECELVSGDMIRAGTTTFLVNVQESRVTVPPLPSSPALADSPDVPLLSDIPPEEPASHNARNTVLSDAETPPATSTTGGAVIQICSDNFAGQKIWLAPQQSVVVGRSPDVDRSFADVPGLANHHFAVEWNERGLHVIDLNSGSPTFVNDQLVNITQLQPGDTIRAGDLIAQVRQIGDRTVKVASSELPDVRVNRAHESPQVTAVASAVRPTARNVTVVPQSYGAVQSDPDEEVRRAALHAAAWSGQGWLLDFCRAMAQRVDPTWQETYYVYAIIAPPAELPMMHALLSATTLGPARFRIASAFAHPATIPYLLDHLAHEDAATAFSAGQAFRRMLGVDLDSDRRGSISLPGDDSDDDFDKEFQQQVWLPDAATAKSHWDSVKSSMENATRVYYGFVVNDRWDETHARNVDLETRWELFLRARFHGHWTGSPAVLERLSRPYPITP